MPYAVLLLAGASGDLGQRIARELALQRRQFSRVAWLLYPRDRPDARKEEEASSAIATLEQVTGEWSEPRSYRGFDIVVSAVGEDLCLEQKVHMDAAVAGGVKHFYPEECEHVYLSLPITWGFFADSEENQTAPTSAATIWPTSGAFETSSKCADTSKHGHKRTLHWATHTS
jgi:hypothetical protein